MCWYIYVHFYVEIIIILCIQWYTLAQNCHSELCCGAHLTCKSTSITPDRNGSVKGPEKHWEATIAIDRKLRQLAPGNPIGWRKFIEIRLAGLWLGRMPFSKTKNENEVKWKQTLNNRWSQLCRYVTGRLQWYSQDTAKSFVKWSSAGLLHSPVNQSHR